MNLEFKKIPVLKNLETGEIICLPYQEVTRQQNGLMIARGFNELYGLVNEKGEEIVPPKYGYIKDFQSNRLARVKDRDSSLYGLIDKKGVEVIPPNYPNL